jgi:hypothetical protein
MATTTATVSITSSDLINGMPLSLNATSSLMQTGLTTGLELMEMGNHEIATGTEFSLAEALGTANDANWIYICNKATDDTYYMDWGINETMMGRLQAGDWMWIPWNMSDAAAEIEVEAQGGTIQFEYAIFKSNWTLPTASS